MIIKRQKVGRLRGKLRVKGNARQKDYDNQKVGRDKRASECQKLNKLEISLELKSIEIKRKSEIKS